MKKAVILCLFIISTFHGFAQLCTGTTNVTLNGEVYDYQLEDCTTNVFINTNGSDTLLHGIMLLDATKSINIKPTGTNRINIRPDDALDFIDLLITDDSIKIDDYLECKSRACNGNLPPARKGPFETIVYPNPVENIATIDIEATIYYYKIVTDYAQTVREGTMPTNKQLNLSALAEGLYYLLMETETEILVERFYKN